MDPVLERCKTHKQTDSEISVNKETESETPVTADWAVQLNNLPYICTIVDITCLLNSLGIVILIIIIIIVVIIARKSALRVQLPLGYQSSQWPHTWWCGQCTNARRLVPVCRCDDVT